MNEFNYIILHLQWEKNAIANALSRCLVVQNESKINILKKWVNETLLKKPNRLPLLDSKGRIAINLKIDIKFLKGICVLNGHRGESIVYYDIKDFYYLKGIRKKIKNITKNCNICLITKEREQKSQSRKYNYFLIQTEKNLS